MGAHLRAAAQRLLLARGLLLGGEPAAGVVDRQLRWASAAAGGGGGDDAPPSAAAAAPKKRGRPPKAKPAADAAAPAPVEAAPSAAAAPSGSGAEAPRPRPAPPAPEPAAAAAAAPSAAAPAAAAEGAQQQPRSLSVADLAPARGTAFPLNRYVLVPDGALPEADAAWWADPVLEGEGVAQPNRGARGVQDEFAATGRRALLARAAVRDVVAALGAEAAGGGPRRRRVLLVGRPGAGKSCALYAAVAWARASGWAALYVPSAAALVAGGTVERDAGDGLWDTPAAARAVLAAAAAGAQAALLARVPTPDGARSAADVAAAGAAAPRARDAVEAALLLKDSMLAADPAATGVRCLVAVDDYNALYWRTGYREPVHAHHARPVAPDELRLAAGFRVMEGPPPAGGVALAATTGSAGVSPALRLPAPRGARLEVPRFGEDEAAAMAAAYARWGLLPGVPAERALRAALFLTGGCGRELRRGAPALLVDDGPIGLSMGYKVAASVRRAHDAAVV